LLEDFVLLFERKFVEFLQNLGRAHASRLAAVAHFASA
jgi:hypothetical protein